MKQSRNVAWLVVTVLVLMAVPAVQAQIVCNPNPLTLNETTASGDVALNYAGGGSANVAGYSLDVEWDNTVATATFARPATGAFSGAITFFVLDIAPGHVRIDAAIGGADPGITAGDLCTMTLTAVAATVGTTDITLTIGNVRDPLNVDVTGVTVVNGLVEVDTGAPVVSAVLIANDTLAHTDDFVKDTDAITVTANVTDDDPGFGAADISADLTALGGGAAVAPDTYVAPLATWAVASVVSTPVDGSLTVTITAVDANSNTSTGTDTITADNTAPTSLVGAVVLPGHEQLHLSWTDIAANDTNPMGVAFRQVAWGDYPAFDTVAPTYPADHTAGTLAIEATNGTTVDWPMTTRDIYYVAGFVYDMVLHYSAAGVDNTGRATNYWLGDVSGADGEVDVINDITQLANTYGLLDTDGGYDAFCDVGPTDTGSTRGIPQPNDDHMIAFEDMMVFALNYSVVSPGGKSRAQGTGGTPNLAWSPVSETEWALSLTSGGGDLQGLKIRADLPQDVTCTVATGTLTDDQDTPAFLRNIPRHGLDAGLALFGQEASFAGSGELLRVTFSEPVTEIKINVTARDRQNQDLAVQMSGDGAAAIPARLEFSQNFPNPFNPQTQLSFALPQDTWVRLVVYDVGGSRIRTLVEGLRVAGPHQVVWDGRDDAGRSVATGNYFALIRAGEDQEIRKMVLLK